MRRALRITAWSAASLALLVLLLLGAVLVYGNTAAGRHWLERETARLTSGKVRIAGLTGTFPWTLRIARARLRDARGPWMSARGVSVHWSPLALVTWDLHIERFDVASAEVLRRPVSTAASTTSGSRLHLPAIDIDRLRIGTLTLEPAAAGSQASLRVSGDLHYAGTKSVRARLAATRTNGRGEYDADVSFVRSQLLARLRLAEPANGPLEHLLDLPGLGRLSVAADLSGPRHAETVRLRARAGALRADAAGTLDLEHRAADLTCVVTSPAMSPRPGLSWRRIALRGRWQGPLAAPHASATAALADLKLPDGAQLRSLRARLEADGRVLTTQTRASGIVLPGSQPRLLAGSPLRIQAVMQLAAHGRPMRLTVTDRLLELQAQVITAGARSATFKLALPHLAPLAALYHAGLGGRLTLRGQLSESGTSTRLDVRGAGDLSGTSSAARLLGDDTHLHLIATLTGAALAVERLDLAGRGLAISAAGTAERSRSGASSPVRSVKLTWRASLPDLALISPRAAGSLAIRGTARGPLSSLTAHVRARSRLALYGSHPGTVRVALDAHGLPSAPSAALTASGMFAGAPLRLAGSLTRASAHAYHIVVTRAGWKSLAIRGELTAGANLAGGRGSLALDIGRLADLEPFVGSALQGSIRGSLALVPSGTRTHARFELIARNLKAAGVSGNLRLLASGPLDALRIRLLAQSPGWHGSPASLAADARLDERSRVLSLERLAARYRGQTVRLLQPSEVMFARGLRVRGLRLGVRTAVLALDGELSPALDFSASLHGVSARLVDAFVPHLLSQGEFAAVARLRGSRAAPIGRASLRISNLELGNGVAQGLPAIDARGSATFRGRTAEVFAALQAGPGSRMQLSGRAPLGSAGAIALRLAGTLDASLMNSILEARGERAAGTLTVDASVTGTARAPQIGGTVRLAHGDLRDYPEGVHLDDINARLVGGRGVLRIASLTARAGPGRLSARGTIGVLQPHMPIEVTLLAHHIQPITSDLLTANLDTRMRVAGTLGRRVDVTGTVHINHASITIPNGMPSSVRTLDVIKPGHAPARVLPKRRRVIGLAITLEAPAALFVQGRGLNAQLGGRLRLGGTAADPRVSGGFSMIRGTFSLAGTSLNFTRGRVSFNGAGLRGRIDPTLDFLAQTTVTDTAPTTVTLRVTGFADSPKLELSSNPSLPQDDLLALLLFGKPASKLNALQVAEVGGGLASLAGVGGGGGGHSWNPLTWIKNGLGLNSLSVGAATPPGGASGGGGTQAAGASITAGKYVSNRVYLAATQSTTGESQIQVDVDLSRHLKLQTRLGNGTATAQGVTPQNDPGSSIGFVYQIACDSPLCL
jgi:translocation and assembly module TamB